MLDTMTALLSRRKEITLEDLALHYGPVELQRPLSKEEFTALAERYPDLGMEREINGSVTVTSPVKKGSSKRESALIGLLYAWNYRQSDLGEVHGRPGASTFPTAPRSRQMPHGFRLTVYPLHPTRKKLSSKSSPTSLQKFVPTPTV